MDPRSNDPTIRERASEAARETEGYVRQHSPDEMMDDARAKTEAVADDLKRKAREAGAKTEDKIDDAMSQTGHKMTNLAQTVRERRPEGQIGEVATATADALDRSGQYLQEHDLDGVRNDLERIIRRYPMQSLFVTAGLSFLLARKMRG